MKKVVMASNPYRDKNFSNAIKAQKILRSIGIESKLCVAFDVDKNFDISKELKLYNLHQEIQSAELLICFGGDGTILHAAKAATDAQIPVLGINIGTMGFMAELESNEMDLLRLLKSGNYSVETRIMLDIQVLRNNEVVFHDFALNDAVVTKGAVARTIQITVSCDHIDCIQLTGDGLILATPTGSTAYSMSAGGPIVEPTAHNIIITPICAHDMMSRPFVTSASRLIGAKIGKAGRKSAFLSVDGGRAFPLFSGDLITATRSLHNTKLIKLKDQSFFDVINHKFGMDKRRSL